MFNRNILDQELKDPQYSKYAWENSSCQFNILLNCLTFLSIFILIRKSY